MNKSSEHPRRSRSGAIPQWLQRFLCPLLAAGMLSGQQAEPVAALPLETGLRVVPLAGNGEFNDIGAKLPSLVVVEVRDADDRIIEGAEVVFRFPPSGPSGYFPGPKLTQTKRTNAQGQATPDGWVPNAQAGPVVLKASATHGNLMGETEIRMINAPQVTDRMRSRVGREIGGTSSTGGFWSSKWVKIGIVGIAAGAAAGGYFAFRNNDGPSTVLRPTITISPGGVAIGGPP